ncbi:unnamed protein product [Sphenostylis stenocarpa]|uniref:Uncharacterized protein n=1 Tax=Sphenostylis stenocarpa TaxID=92480 RepID=A0AA86W575_9FABA|nr:unnamed protein product [Sphenostylis stenocarpa]
MEAALGNSKDYSLKQYLKFVDKLQMKAKELSSEVDSFTPSDVERVLRRMRLFTFRLRFRAGITGAISVRTKSEQAHARHAAARAQFHDSFASEVQDAGVGVVVRWWGPSLREFDEDEGAGPHGGSHVISICVGYLSELQDKASIKHICFGSGPPAQ